MIAITATAAARLRIARKLSPRVAARRGASRYSLQPCWAKSPGEATLRTKSLTKTPSAGCVGSVFEGTHACAMHAALGDGNFSVVPANAVLLGTVTVTAT